MKTTRIAAIALMMTACGAVLAAARPAETPAPAAAAAVDPAYMWDLTPLYPSAEAWTAERDRVKAEIQGFDKYKGTLGKSAKAMLTALSAFSDAQRTSARLAAYAGLRADEDVRIAVNQERNQLAAALQTLYNEKTA